MKSEAEKIKDAILSTIELETKSNKEIAALLIEHIWPDYSILSAQSNLIDEAIQRLN